MTENNQDVTETGVSYYAVLDKFDGEGTDEENLVERLHIQDDVIVKLEKFENGELVSSEDVTEEFTGYSE